MRKLVTGILFAACLAIAGAAFAQAPGGPFTAPSHETFLGPSIGKQWTGVCTASGATPQTCNATKGAVTTNTLSTAAGSTAVYVINNNLINSNTILSCDMGAYSGTFFTNGLPQIGSCVAGAGTLTITFINPHATNALNGTIQIFFNIVD